MQEKAKAKSSDDGVVEIGADGGFDISASTSSSTLPSPPVKPVVNAPDADGNEEEKEDDSPPRT